MCVCARVYVRVWCERVRVSRSNLRCERIETFNGRIEFARCDGNVSDLYICIAVHIRRSIGDDYVTVGRYAIRSFVSSLRFCVSALGWRESRDAPKRDRKEADRARADIAVSSRPDRQIKLVN